LITFKEKKKRKKILGNDNGPVLFPVVNWDKARDKHSMVKTSTRQEMGQKEEH